MSCVRIRRARGGAVEAGQEPVHLQGQGVARQAVADLPADPPAPPASGRAPWSTGRTTLIAVAGALALAVILVAAIIAGHVFAAAPSWVVALVILKLVRGGPSHHSDDLRHIARR